MKDNYDRENKRRFQLWIKPSLLEQIDTHLENDNCHSRCEFIEKAIVFYMGYLSSNKSQGYLPNVVTSTLKSIVAESDNRICRMLFKMAVELAVTMNVVASTNEINRVDLDRLRGTCVDEVKKLNGSLSFDDAYEWQKDE